MVVWLGLSRTHCRIEQHARDVATTSLNKLQLGFVLSLHGSSFSDASTDSTHMKLIQNTWQTPDGAGRLGSPMAPLPSAADAYWPSWLVERTRLIPTPSSTVTRPALQTRRGFIDRSGTPGISWYGKRLDGCECPVRSWMRKPTDYGCRNANPKIQEA